MYKYPYGDSQQLNLDWIIAKIKELEAGEGADLEEVSNALISLPYNTTTAYRRYDYAFLNGKLYRCLTDTSGVFNPTAWQEALIGDDLAVLTRWINAIDAAAVVDVKFDTAGTNGKLQQKYHDQYHDVVEVDYTPVQNSKRPLSSNAGYELNGAITNNQKQITPYIETGTTASRNYSKGEYLIYNGLLYVAISTISSGANLTPNTNIVQNYVVYGFLPKDYVAGEHITFNGAELGLSAANNLVNVIIRTERQIPSSLTITPTLTVGWIRYNGITDGNVEFVSAGRSTANSFIVTVRATNGISAGNVCGVFLQGDIALS